MDLCCRNLLTSSFIKLGPSFDLVLFCWGFFNLFVVVCFFFIWMFEMHARGPTGKGLVLVIQAAILLPSFCYRIFCRLVIYAVLLPEWRPFGHYISSIFLNFSAGNSVLKTVSRERHPSLLVQAVLWTLGSCVCGCTKSPSLTVIWQSCQS